MNTCTPYILWFSCLLVCALRTTPMRLPIRQNRRGALGVSIETISTDAIGSTGLCTGVQRGTPPRIFQLIDRAQQREAGTVQIGVARNPPLKHAFGQSLRHLAHNNWRSRVERRSTPRGSPAGTEPPDRSPGPQRLVTETGLLRHGCSKATR